MNDPEGLDHLSRQRLLPLANKQIKIPAVEYDHDRGTVRYQPDEQIEAVLDSLPVEVAQANP